MKTPEDLAKQVFGRRAAMYAGGAHADPTALARLVELAAPEAEWRALDVATGAGHMALALAPYVTDVTGIDLTPEMLAEAERLKAERGLVNVRFQPADGRALPFPDEAFDLVTCRRAVHHFSDPGRALREMHRVLRRGRRLVIEDRSVPEDDWADICLNELDRLHDESHVREYRPSEWRRMLAKAGFHVETVEVFTQHRPLSALTDGVSAGNTRRIKEILDHLNEEQKNVLNYAIVDRQVYLNHWYLRISGMRTA